MFSLRRRCVTFQPRDLARILVIAGVWIEISSVNVKGLGQTLESGFILSMKSVREVSKLVLESATNHIVL
ncbi:MAG: hypothetical protein V2I43_11140, partial [Parvularcula sp.]|nr:hypothetical protein [Parvularcula sp.]